MKTLHEFAVKLTSLLDDEDKVALARSNFLSIMRKIESEGYTVTGDDSTVIEEDLKKFFGTKGGMLCAMSMLQFISAIGANPSDHGIDESDDDYPFNRNVNVTLN